jgi:hypothetical protein
MLDWELVAHTCNCKLLEKLKSGGLRFETSLGK